jgi:hypothetical protein
VGELNEMALTAWSRPRLAAEWGAVACWCTLQGLGALSRVQGVTLVTQVVTLILLPLPAAADCMTWAACRL